MSTVAPPAPVAARRPHQIWIGLACIGIIVGLWSGFQLISRFGTVSGMNAADLTAVRFGVSGTIMLPFLLRNGLRGVPLHRALVLAACGGLGFSFFAFTGFMFAPTDHAAALLSGALPLFTALPAVLIGERLGAMKAAGLMLIVAGATCIGAESLVAASLGYWRGDLCFLAAAMFWAIFTLACRAWNVTPVQSAVLVCTLSMIMYLPIYLTLASPHLADVATPVLLLQVIFQGIVATIGTMYVYTRAVAILGAGTTTMMTAAVPGIVTLLAAPLLGEVPTWLSLVGVALVSVGMVATVLTLRPAPAKP